MYKTFKMENLKRQDHLVTFLGVDDRIILKYILHIWCLRVCIL